MKRLRHSLFIKVYLTLLASLVVVAIASAIFVRLSHDREDISWQGRLDTLLIAILPDSADDNTTRMTIERLAKAFDTDIGLYDFDGRPIAVFGKPPPPDQAPHRGGARRDREDWHGFALKLSDGRILTAHVKQPFGPAFRSPLFYLVLIAGIIGLASYPVVRQLTRRLEKLRHGVETWGETGRLARVDVGGRDEVAAVAVSFNAAADRIETLIASHRSLLANASHELRSPLARLRMAIDIFEKSPSEPTKQEIVQNLSELDSLVGEILLASRLDHVEGLEHFEIFDLMALASEEGAREDIAVTGEEAKLSGDPKLIARLVRNLMLNAKRHGAPPINVSVAKSSDSVILRVSDNGAGIAEADRERIFEAFYRPVGRSEQAGGWGLGLSLVQQIARHHGGAVRYETEKGGGSVFAVSLPAAE